MVYNFCNQQLDASLDTSKTISIIKKSHLPLFNHLDRKKSILQVLNSLPDTADAIHMPFLIEKNSINAATNVRNQNEAWSLSIQFPFTPQNANVLQVLNTYNNTEVVALIHKTNSAKLYGTSLQPLLFTFEEINSPVPQSLKGFSISITGRTYGSPLYFTNQEITENPIVQGLAFPLSGPL
ncbi:hypothetical protein [Mesonia sp. HuA40]|uniref:hypothetical protein n=1 Tax=Mesonia sp. HuA40 TaxID=2602761 RepID=UPI0011CA8A58|nr:hypothetical protein [Mesonia sp. HuA40]TXK73938.1 hypothetical protein FT993_03505 [Mesonia sp. HuA40]